MSQTGQRGPGHSLGRPQTQNRTSCPAISQVLYRVDVFIYFIYLSFATFPSLLFEWARILICLRQYFFSSVLGNNFILEKYGIYFSFVIESIFKQKQKTCDQTRIHMAMCLEVGINYKSLAISQAECLLVLYVKCRRMLNHSATTAYVLMPACICFRTR